MAKRSPINAPFALDYTAAEIGLGINWLDGKPIFQRVFTVTGGNNVSSIADVSLLTLIDTLVSAAWTTFDIIAGVYKANTSTEPLVGPPRGGIEISAVAGVLFIYHGGSDLTGSTAYATITYTKP